MLTKTDLGAIDKLLTKQVRAEIEAEGRNIRDELKGDLRMPMVRIQPDIRDLADRMKNLEVRVNTVDARLMAVEKSNQAGFSKLNQRFIELFDFLD